MAKKKEPTSRGVIRDLLAKAWAKVKGKPRSERGTKADVEAREIKRIAEKTGRSAKQIRDIEGGKRPGKNLLDPLKQIKRGRKVTAPPKEPKKITRAKKPVAPPPPPAKPRPDSLKVKVRGDIAPFKDPDYLRLRTIITPALRGEALDKFLNLWQSGEEKRAFDYAVSAYFGDVPDEQREGAPRQFKGYMPEMPESYEFINPLTNEPVEI